MSIQERYRKAVEHLRFGQYEESLATIREGFRGRPRTEDEWEIRRWRVPNLGATAAYLCGRSDPRWFRYGRRLAEIAERNHPCAGCRTNRAFFVDSAERTFQCFETKPISVSPPDPFVPLNPSVWWDGPVRRAIVRTVNYRRNSEGWFVLGDVCQTRNFVVTFDDRWAVIDLVEMLDETCRLKFVEFPQGYEDCRPFRWGSDNVFVATVCDANDRGIQEMILVRLDDRFSCVDFTLLRGPWSSVRQKNWVPVVDGDRLHFLYAIGDSPIVLTYRSDGIRPIRAQDDFTPTSFRGSSQAVRLSDGWIFVGHERIDEGRSVYTHRFVRMNERFEVVAMSRPFYFLKRGIEFCAGLVQDRDRLVVSFGVDDREAWLGFFSLSEVLDETDRRRYNRP